MIFDAVSESRLRALAPRKWTEEGVIGAHIAETDFGTAPAVTAALERFVSDGAFGYLPDSLEGAHHRAFADFQSWRHGWAVDPTAVRTLPDVLTALQLVIEATLPPDGRVILPTPAYMAFFPAVGLTGRTLVEVPMVQDGTTWTHDLDALDAALAVGPSLLILCTPHNPTGRVFTRGELDELTALADRHGARVFADEIHAPLVYDGATHLPYAASSETAARLALTVTSASKAWNLPAFKCAQVVLTNPDDAAWWKGAGSWAGMSASTPGVVAATAAYGDGRDWLDEEVAYLGEYRRTFAELLAHGLPEATVTVPEGTYLAWVDARGLGLPGEPGAWFLEHAKVRLTPGLQCGRAGAGFVRVNLATSRAILGEIAERMIGAVAAR